MRKLAAVLVLLGVVGAGRAGDEDVWKALREAGVIVYEGKKNARIGAGGILYYGATNVPFHGEWEVEATIWYSETRATDSKLGDLCKLKEVPFLGFDKADLTNAGMSTLGRLRQVGSLKFYDSAITDAGLRKLTPLSVENLTLDNCPEVTDGCIESLVRMRRLGGIVVRGRTGITKEGIARLRKALPNTWIFFKDEPQ
jgi:hypothetical protein